MKKIFLLLITLLLLTGCKATYEINFDESINEEIRIYTENSNIQNATQKQSENFYEQLDDWERAYEYYKKEMYNDLEYTGYKYTDSFNYKEYDALTQLRKCYEDFAFSKNDFIELKTSNEFLCASYYTGVESLELRINSKYNIINSNADQKDGNTHIWLINKTNYKNKPIILKIDTTKNAKKESKDKKTNIKMIVSIIIFIILIIALIITKKKR